MTTTESLADKLLYFLAITVSDLETARIAAQNRHRQLTRAVSDADGEDRGFGLPEDDPAVRIQASAASAFAEQEVAAVKELERRMRAHPLGPWIKAQRGIGDKMGARLLAAIGDPAWHSLDDRPRGLYELFSYCGYGQIEQHGDSGVALRRRAGYQANWNPEAKMRAYLIAEKIVMQPKGTPWRDRYDWARAKYADAVHVTPCVRCGPEGHPAPAGTPLPPGHQHARALRYVAKEVLRGLWIEARRLHGLEVIEQVAA